MYDIRKWAEQALWRLCSAVTMEVMAVTCQEAEHLAHIESCRNCQEELEIYFMVDVGLKQLDKGYGTFDIAGALERRIEESYSRVHRMWLFRSLKYAVNMLSIMAVIVTVLLQFRIWFF